MTNYLYRPKIKKIGNLVKGNGSLFYETFVRGNEKFGNPSNPNFLLENGELITFFKKNFRILNFYNGQEFSYKKSIIQNRAVKKHLLIGGV